MISLVHNSYPNHSEKYKKLKCKTKTPYDYNKIRMLIKTSYTALKYKQN